MDDIDNPTGTYVKRWDVLIMLKRINDKFGTNIENNNVLTCDYITTVNPAIQSASWDIILDWEQTLYYDNGQLYTKWNYKNGEKDWVWESYYLSGQLESKETYDNLKYILIQLIFSVSSLIFISLYNDKKRKNTKLLKIILYSIYPIQLVILLLIKNVI